MMGIGRDLQTAEISVSEQIAAIVDLETFHCEKLKRRLRISECAMRQLENQSAGQVVYEGCDDCDQGDENMIAYAEEGRPVSETETTREKIAKNGHTSVTGHCKNCERDGVKVNLNNGLCAQCNYHCKGLLRTPKREQKLAEAKQIYGSLAPGSRRQTVYKNPLKKNRHLKTEKTAPAPTERETRSIIEDQIKFETAKKITVKGDRMIQIHFSGENVALYDAIAKLARENEREISRQARWMLARYIESICVSPS